MAANFLIDTYLKFKDLGIASTEGKPDFLNNGVLAAITSAAWEVITKPENQQSSKVIDEVFLIGKPETDERDTFFMFEELPKVMIVPGNQLIFNQVALNTFKSIQEEHGYVLAKTKVPSIVYQNREEGGNLIDHYFLYHKADGYILDLLNWALDIPTMYEYLDILPDAQRPEEWNNLRSNPYDPDTYSSDQTPLMLWLAVRSVFLKGTERHPNESTKSYITRVFRIHKLDDGLTRKEAVGKAYAIATSTLQKHGYLKKGKREATRKGLEQGDFLIESLGADEIENRFDEFEMMLNLEQGKRYANY